MATAKNLTKKSATAKKSEESVVEEPVVETEVTETAEEATEATVAEEAPVKVEDTITVEPKVSAGFDESVAEKPVTTTGNNKLCRVRLAKSHSCTIGGTTWRFEKDKVYDVPPNVKRILSKGDLLRPLR